MPRFIIKVTFAKLLLQRVGIVVGRSNRYHGKRDLTGLRELQ
jgi:hypothetical protein